MRILSVLVLLFGLVVRAYAAPNLVVTSLVRMPEPPPAIVWNILYTLDNWSSEDNTLVNCTDCMVELMYVRGGIPRQLGAGWRLDFSGQTLGQLIVKLNSAGYLNMPFRSLIWFRGGFSELLDQCLQLQVRSYPSLLRQPISNCSVIPRPNTTPTLCDISGNTTIDHRTLSGTALNGAQASTQLNIKCNASASVSVRATRTNSYGVSLRSDDSLYSVVTINNQDATNGINMSVTGNLDSPLSITSTLVTRGAVAPGPFSGSTVITVSPN